VLQGQGDQLREINFSRNSSWRHPTCLSASSNYRQGQPHLPVTITENLVPVMPFIDPVFYIHTHTCVKHNKIEHMPNSHSLIPSWTKDVLPHQSFSFMWKLSFSATAIITICHRNRNPTSLALARQVGKMLFKMNHRNHQKTAEFNKPQHNFCLQMKYTPM